MPLVYHIESYSISKSFPLKTKIMLKKWWSSWIGSCLYYHWQLFTLSYLGVGHDTPLMPFFLHDLETAQAIKLTHSDSEDTLVRHIWQVISSLQPELLPWKYNCKRYLAECSFIEKWNFLIIQIFIKVLSWNSSQNSYLNWKIIPVRFCITNLMLPG